MKKIILLFAFIISVAGYAQDLNRYKYVIVPERFDFLKDPDQYSLNTLVKKIFENQGFLVYYSNDDMPIEVRAERCNSLYADVVKSSGFLTTNLTITLKDCKGNMVFSSITGKSKEKEHKKAYYEALREASRSLDIAAYAAKGGIGTETPVAAAVVKSAPASRENQLIARPTANGYDLIDNSQKPVLKMFRTSQPDSYTAQMETLNGVVFKKDGEWVFEYYLNDELVSQKLNIKF